MTSHDGGHFVDHESLRRMVLKHCTQASFRDAKSDLCICNDNKNENQYHLCMTIAIKMVLNIVATDLCNISRFYR